MGKFSRDKGKRGENELVRVLKSWGYDAHRTAQYCGNTGEAADVVGLPHCHIECKRVERLNIYDAIAQATNDAKKDGKMPVVFHRKNGCKWLVTLGVDDFMLMYREWEASVYGEAVFSNGGKA